MKIVPFFIVILLFTCNCKQHTSTSTSTFPIPSDKDINSVVQTIISEENLPVEIHSVEPIPLDSELRKITVLNTNNQNDSQYPPPIDRNVEQMENLIDTDYSIPFFTKADSAYFLFQNDILPRYSLRAHDSLNLRDDIHKSNIPKFYDISIPIFSLDGQKAYVIITNNCNQRCGGGYSVYLKKNEGTWVISRRRILWQN